MFEKCVHDPYLLHREEMKSKFEILSESPRTISGTAFPMDFNEICKKKVTLVFACKKCGAILTTVEVTN